MMQRVVVDIEQRIGAFMVQFQVAELRVSSEASSNMYWEGARIANHPAATGTSIAKRISGSENRRRLRSRQLLTLEFLSQRRNRRLPLRVPGSRRIASNSDSVIRSG